MALVYWTSTEKPLTDYTPPQYNCDVSNITVRRLFLIVDHLVHNIYSGRVPPFFISDFKTPQRLINSLRTNKRNKGKNWESRTGLCWWWMSSFHIEIKRTRGGRDTPPFEKKKKYEKNKTNAHRYSHSNSGVCNILTVYKSFEFFSLSFS